MAFRSEAGRSEARAPEAGKTRSAGRNVDLSWDNPEFDEADKPARDWKKLFLVIGLGLLSWVATYVGMLELIEANMGDLPLIHKVIIGFSVAMLMTMVVWLLDQMFSDIGWFTRMVYTAGYVFLTVISVGFGFGFYWKVLESRGEASRSAESAVGQVQNSLHAAVTRLEQLQGTLDSLNTISTQKATTERDVGTSCPNSKPGDGPRRKMRDDDAARFKFASDFVKGRIGTIKGDLTGLDGDLAKIVKDDRTTVDAKSGNRNEFMRNLGRKLDMTVTGFNAFRTDPQLKQIRIDLNERADKVTFVDTKGGTYTCPDSQLTTALKGVVRAIDELPSLEKPKIAAVEGSEAVIEAFRRLTATFYGALSFKLPPSPEELRELQKKAVQSVEANAAQQAKLTAMAEQAGLSKRDYVPLAIAIFVDICLLLVSMKAPGSRLQNLLPKMRAAERGPVIQILSRFNEIHRDKEIRENFEVFRHVVFDFHGDYYAAVPMNTPYRPNPKNGAQRQGYGVSDAQDLLQEAHLLANLFTSFEKEKIFTRVYSPLLSTGTVQKRLRRQGSKFANAEAFRLYRFRDGAWSDIILGAVMGAARRVEADKRRRRVEDEIFRSNEPTLPGDLSHVAAGTARAGAPAGEWVPPAQPAYPPTYPYVVGGMPQGDGFGPVPNGAPHPGYTGFANPALASAPGQAPGSTATTGAGFASRQPFMPRSETMAPDRLPDRRPANNNTEPRERRGDERIDDVARAEAVQHASRSAMASENVILHPAVNRSAAPTQPAPVTPVPPASASLVEAPAEPTVTVEATRETFTYRVPVSEAQMPAGLLRATQGATARVLEMTPMAEEVRAIEASTSAVVSDVAPAVIKVLPPPLPNLAPPVAETAIEVADVIALPEAAADQSARVERAGWEAAQANGWRMAHDTTLNAHIELPDDIRTMARRFGPQNRES